MTDKPYISVAHCEDRVEPKTKTRHQCIEGLHKAGGAASDSDGFGPMFTSLSVAKAAKEARRRTNAVADFIVSEATSKRAKICRDPRQEQRQG